jgi:hypothetical protein
VKGNDGSFLNKESSPGHANPAEKVRLLLLNICGYSLERFWEVH